MKLLFILLLVISCHSLFAQDSIIMLEGISINRYTDNDVKKMIKNIRKSLIKNYGTGVREYKLEQLSVLNNRDTLINNTGLYLFDIKSADNRFVKTQSPHTEGNSHKSEAFFSKFKDSNDSPEFWLRDILLRKNLNILGFDFFNNIKDYTYEVTTDTDVVTIHYSSEEMYSGFFTFNKINYNLKTISLTNVQPYPFSVTGTDNGKLRSLKTWIYVVENTVIDFAGDDNGYFWVANITATEEIADYTLEKYDSKGNCISKEAPCAFHSEMKLANVH